MKVKFIILIYLVVLIYINSEYVNQLKNIFIKNNIVSNEYNDISYLVYTICTDKSKIEDIIIYVINSLKKIDIIFTRRIYNNIDCYESLSKNKITEIINSIEKYIIQHGIKNNEKIKFKKNIDFIKLHIIKYIIDIKNKLFSEDEIKNLKGLGLQYISTNLINKLEINDNNHFYYNIYFIIKNILYKRNKNNEINKRKLHIGLILDGNRRFAKKNSFSNGHLFGSFNAIRIINYLYYANIKECTLYVLSYDNLIKRSNEEKIIIYSIIYSYLLELINYLVTNENIYVQFIGEINLLPENIQERINNINNICNLKNIEDCYVINYAIAYDGRREIYYSLKSHFLELEKEIEINSNMMWLKRDIDIVIRSGGTQRMSSFFPWQTIYSEWYFLEKYWPEVTEEDVSNIINNYNNKIMNFGV
jgi:undecaprenyl diphosphate synthase